MDAVAEAREAETATDRIYSSREWKRIVGNLLAIFVPLPQPARRKSVPPVDLGELEGRN